MECEVKKDPLLTLTLPNPRTPIGSEIVAQLYVDMNYNQAMFA